MSTPRDPAPDVRMRGFAHRATVEDAWRWIDSCAQPLPAESVSLLEAAGRVLASDVISPVDVPLFPRAMMDGYAVQSSDTSGASDYNRLMLHVVGQSMPGRPAQVAVQSGQAVRIMTGAPVPGGADAVLPVEKSELAGDQVAVLEELSPGKHVGRRGEDITQGSTVLSSGRRLRPQDVGVISSIGIAELQVIRTPRVRILVTGDELLPAGSPPEPYRITDANSPMLAALVARDGGLPLAPEMIADRKDAIWEALQQPADIVLVSGGSSVGQEDYAPQVLAEHGELAIHGIAMRPSSPAGMGRLQERLVFLLPGNPVSCLCAYDFFAGRAIRILTGRGTNWPYAVRRLPLRRKLVSVVGRVDYARVRIVDNQVEPVAISGASVLSSTTRASGFVIVSADSEGFPVAAEVDVYLYDN